ncbi:MAG: tetratricopeptide repeat protein [Sphingobacteriaceae bacterium]|nr:tetratricopeptide repeat protein [Sphingobacteriaceae bacterium]
MPYKFTFFLLVLPVVFFTQPNRKADSLLAIMKNCNDSTYVYTACLLVDELCELKDIHTAFKYLDSAKIRAVNAGRPRYLGYVFVNMGNTYNYLSDYNKALENFDKSAVEYKKANYLPGLASAIMDKGNSYYYLGELEKAKKAYLDALEIQLKCPPDNNSLANIYNNLGIISGMVKKYKEAEEYFLKVISLNEKAKDYLSLGKTYNNLYIVYSNNNRDKEAKEYLEKSIELKMKYGFNIDKSEALHLRASIFEIDENYAKAIEYNLKSLQFLDTNVHNTELRTIYSSLANLYQIQKKFEQANHYVWLLNKINEEISEAETNRLTQKNDMIAIYRQNHLKDSLIQTSFIQKQNNEIKQSNIIKFSLLAILATISVFSFLLYQRFKLIKEQNKLITFQKKIVEEKNNEIVSSIQYAQRIQRSLLPTDKFIERIFSKKKP